MRQRQTIPLNWLDEHHATGLKVGVSWGVPWQKGQLSSVERLTLYNQHGHAEQLDSKAAAYWPDGSIKWTLHAAELDNEMLSSFSLTERDAAEHEHEAAERKEKTELNSFVREQDDCIVVENEHFTCSIARHGTELLQVATHNKDMAGELQRHPLVKSGKLRLLLTSSSDSDNRKIVHYAGSINEARIESAGAVRAVIVVKGHHMAESTQHRLQQSIPFTLRFVFYRHQSSFELKHTFIYDGDHNHVFIAGLGITFNIAMAGHAVNRHIRFAGDTGWFAEAARGMMLNRLPDYMREKYGQQLNGEAVSFDLSDAREAGFVQLLNDAAMWNDFKLTQLTPDSYRIQKRTDKGPAWIHALYGNRARGFMYVGSEAGGIGIGLKHFWQLCPSGFEVNGLSDHMASATLWLWSPDAEPMDLRHYDDRTHVYSEYEGDFELRSSPQGIAHTSDCFIHIASKTPSHAELQQLTLHSQYTPLLVCTPEQYAHTGVFGTYSLPNYDTEKHAALEYTLEQIWRFYMKEIDQRKWYGFWDYGDVMHSYDPGRHTWKYDIGGCAWQNTELVPNKWLWYSFLRTGNSDLFYMAEAMTRHTSETDLYHLGEYQGLGSRHNVLHYGCGCKEARIGMATLHRFYYFLTGDERIGEIMDEVKDSDYATVQLDPMRAYFGKDEFVTHTRSGPDWSAFCSNWLVQIERYQNKFYLEKLNAGITSLKSMPYRLLSGPTFGYDPNTGILSDMGHENYDYHMMICMGGPQVWIEIADLYGDDTWREMLVELGEFYNLSPEEKSERTAGAFTGKKYWGIPMLATLLMAYASFQRQDDELGRRAWDILTTVRDHWQLQHFEATAVDPLHYAYPIEEVNGLSTNTASQWSLNVMMSKAYIGHLI